MADNSKLSDAKKNKKDEFYTQYSDIEAEMNAYVEYNPDVFRNKTILLPCDDPEWSNFTKYFASNFERFGIKKLISTSYSKGAGNKQISLFEQESPLFDLEKHDAHGKLFVLTHDTDGSGNIDIDDIEFTGYLEGDGDFRSEEVCKLRDEADFIITNPPFSLFREFLAWILEAEKQFIIIGSINVITYKEVFPLLKNNDIWIGYRFNKRVNGKNMTFRVPDSYPMKGTELFIGKDGNKYISVAGTGWFTNVDLSKRHEWLELDTMAHNLKYNKSLRKKLEKEYGEIKYPRYDNYDALEVPFTECIPSDYDDVMGVPVTFMDKYNPEQFEIIGLLQSSTDEQAGIPNKRYYNDFKEMRQDMTYTGSAGTKANGNPVVQGKAIKGNFLYNPKNGEYVHSLYARIVIRHKKGGNTE